ncbi:uncharacterized protein CXQ87_001449 [Candidozyma duobushaemuli]|uniref:Uncharacterized protein n=1 Tax=Candidozyma duobushaemuli TaxID=1231522 RepID=A0A2V1AKY3_9ASCO|nr:uncharacterized protein CXQ87_001449 [[Candida] duobushaemulonis]PVH18518.1 hypothetical protein CXQ87_001449 [[Candida] duobushaemulonis]
MEPKLIKHNPGTKLRNKTALDTTFLVKGSTPYMSAVKRIDKMLEKFDTSGKVRYITVKGMGKAINTAVSIALHFQTKKQYKVDVKTGTVEVLDELRQASEYSTKDSDDEEATFKKRSTSYVDIKIWLKRGT